MMGTDIPTPSEILRKASAKFRIFPLKRSVLENPCRCLIWKTPGDPMEFLSFAEEASAKVIYHYINEGKNSSQAEYHELAYIDGCFIHVFPLELSGSATTDAAKPEHGKEDPSIVSRNPEDLAAEMADYVMLNLDYMSPDTFNLQYFFRKYWQSKGLDPELPPESDLRKFMNQVEELATRKIKARR